MVVILRKNVLLNPLTQIINIVTLEWFGEMKLKDPFSKHWLYILALEEFDIKQQFFNVREY